jgi:hypothetical protein
MSPDPAIVLRDRIFFICLWMVLLVATISALALMYTRNEATYLGVLHVVAAPVVMGALSYMWYSIYQLIAYMEERSARVAHGASNASFATFTKTMYFMTACFAVIATLLAYGAYSRLSSFGTTAYLPAPLPLDFSPFGLMYLLLWTSAIWYSWQSPSGEAETEVQLRAIPQHSAHAARLAKANGDDHNERDDERDTAAIVTDASRREGGTELCPIAVSAEVDAAASVS